MTDQSIPQPIKWVNDHLLLLDQRQLPHKEEFICCKTMQDGIDAICDMVVRGAPCIGYTGIFSLALWAQNSKDLSRESLVRASSAIKDARPTAVNLMFEVDRTVNLIFEKKILENNQEYIKQFILNEASEQMRKAESLNLDMAKFAIKDLSDRFGNKKLNLMTHCNTGYLACGTLGTALGVISYANKMDRVNKVYADETRPYMQGSRLTAYELSKERIPFEIVVEGASSYLLSNGLVDAIYVGADRIAANGDTANKIGTASLALVAHHYKIPFFVVAPLSSFDFSIDSGAHIHIELRSPTEILCFNEMKIAPSQAQALNPSFDVTPSNLITGIICEKGIVYNPNIFSMKALL